MQNPKWNGVCKCGRGCACTEQVRKALLALARSLGTHPTHFAPASEPNPAGRAGDAAGGGGGAVVVVVAAAAAAAWAAASRTPWGRDPERWGRGRGGKGQETQSTTAMIDVLGAVGTGGDGGRPGWGVGWFWRTAAARKGKGLALHSAGQARPGPALSVPCLAGIRNLPPPAAEGGGRGGDGCCMTGRQACQHRPSGYAPFPLPLQSSQRGPNISSPFGSQLSQSTPLLSPNPATQRCFSAPQHCSAPLNQLVA
jgi:hypothetical protein